MLNFLLDLIFPRTCVGCGKWGKYFCDKCVTKIDYFTDQVCPYCERPSPYGLTHPRCQKAFGIDGMYTLAHYRGPIQKAIQLIKYRNSWAICQELAELIGKNYHDKYNFDYLVPVPLAPKRERKRGFNQAEKLAGELVKCLRTTDHRRLTVVNLLKRTRETKPQFDLKYSERQKNVHEAFTLSNQYPVSSVQQTSFCLVDDVSTTGSTIFECAKILKKAGASKVFAICVARGG